MKSLSSLGIGLSVVFGCLLLALIAEIYYLLWWKRRIIHREIQEHQEQEEDNHQTNSSSRREFFYLFCWKKPSSLSSTTTALNPLRFTDIESQTHCVKPYGDLQLDSNGSNIENELMRLHSLSGPTRLLFTIKEETREDLESEDGGMGKFGSGRSDLIVAMETPYLTPLSSPSFFTPPMTPLKESSGNCCYNNHGFNPLFESSTDVEISKIKSSPPPKFKFLKDAEEKLYRKSLNQEEEIKINDEIYHDSESENGSSNYITILVAKNNNLQEPISSSSPSLAKSKSNSKVKPLLASSSSCSSSPSSIRSINVLKPMFHLSSKD